jgi:hypothetical protein
VVFTGVKSGVVLCGVRVVLMVLKKKERRG